MSARDELVYFMRCINEREADGLSYWVVDDHDTMRIDLHKLAAEIQRTLDAQAAVIAAAVSAEDALTAMAHVEAIYGGQISGEVLSLIETIVALRVTTLRAQEGK